MIDMTAAHRVSLRFGFMTTPGSATGSPSDSGLAAERALDEPPEAFAERLPRKIAAAGDGRLVTVTSG
jgi:hypothetical protein